MSEQKPAHWRPSWRRGGVIETKDKRTGKTVWGVIWDCAVASIVERNRTLGNERQGV